MKRYFSGLWQHPDFMKLWAGQTVSEFGSRITREGLPLIAVTLLSATPEQMGLLTAIGSLPILIFGLMAGVWVDRLKRRPILIGCDLVRALILLSIPLAALTGQLSMSLILIVAALNSLLGLFFDVAYRSILPSLVKREQLVEGNSKLATTDSLAEIGGPAIAGLLVQWISAPMAIFVDAFTFLFSAVSVGMIRKAEPTPIPEEQPNMLREIVEGLRIIALEPTLRVLVLGLATRSFFGNFIGTLYALYAVRDLGLSPALLGLTVSAGGIGALMGAVLAGRLPRRFGLGRTLVISLLIAGLMNLCIPLADGPIMLAAGILIIAQIVGDGAMMVYGVNEMSLRQMIVPGHVLGRTNASIGFLSEGIGPIGALIAGVLAGLIGARATLLIATLGILATAVGLLFSKVHTLKTHPELVTE
jgi:MFS family permease